MKSILKFFSFLLALTLVISCEGKEDNELDATDPGKATLITPENNKTCETGSSISETQSQIEFTWTVTLNTDSYDLAVTDLNTISTINKTGLTSAASLADLDKGVPYSWYVISKNSASSKTTNSDTWKFYVAGKGIVNYAPFTAELKTPKSGATVARDGFGKVKFTWDGSDPDAGDTLKYTLYVDKIDGKQTPPSSQTDIDGETLEVELEATTAYYWRVKTSDGVNSSFSNILTFNTE
tara:strand:- start:2257 stop:2970 length:714 start_codon:yes stop_codon:yes gene_type:complete